MIAFAVCVRHQTMDRQAKYNAIMERAGEKWSEYAYFILSNAVRVHATNDWSFMQFYIKGFELCEDEELKASVEELRAELEKEYLKLAWFVDPDHHY